MRIVAPTILSFACLAAGTVAFAQSATERLGPPMMQPSFGVMSIDGADRVKLIYTTFSSESREESYTVAVPSIVKKTVNGIEVEETVVRTEVRTRVVEHVQVVRRLVEEPLQKFKLARVSGKKVNTEEINAVREKQLPVIVLQPTQTIDPYYQWIVNLNAFVITLPDTVKP